MGRPDAPAGSFTAVSVGSFVSCGLGTDQTVACWDWESRGVKLLDVPKGRFLAVSAGIRHACGLTVDETITCWAAHDLGRLDFGQLNAPRGPVPRCFADQNHTCALRTDGTITCWGQDYRGQLDAPEGRFGPAGLEVKTEQTGPGLVVDPATVPSAGSYDFTIKGTGFNPRSTIYVLICTIPGAPLSVEMPAQELATALAEVDRSDCDLTTAQAVNLTVGGSFSIQRSATVGPNFMWVASDAAETQTAGVPILFEEP